MTQQNLALVEDDPDLSTTLTIALERDGYRVARFATGREGLEGILDNPPDLVILDLNLPDLDGLGVCRELRETPAVADLPIIILTARVTESDRVLGLDLGADDYITKPFSPRELVARVRAVLRRVQGGVHQPGLIRAGDLEIDLNGHRVTRAGEGIQLTRTEFNLLAVLAQHPGQTFTRAQLLDRLHGVAHEGFDRSIDAHVKNLRRKLEVDPLEPHYVLTVYGVGYKFTDEV
jgi:two-component system alkaline phosphatase synthesis response regulator PhoP